MVHGFLLLEIECTKTKDKTEIRLNKKEIFCASFEMDFSPLLVPFRFIFFFHSVFIKMEKKKRTIIFDLLWSIEKNLKGILGFLWKF